MRKGFCFNKNKSLGHEERGLLVRKEIREIRDYVRNGVPYTQPTGQTLSLKKKENLILIFFTFEFHWGLGLPLYQHIGGFGLNKMPLILVVRDASSYLLNLGRDIFPSSP